MEQKGGDTRPLSVSTKLTPCAPGDLLTVGQENCDKGPNGSAKAWGENARWRQVFEGVAQAEVKEPAWPA
jgi:hypothetical protein